MFNEHYIREAFRYINSAFKNSAFKNAILTSTGNWVWKKVDK